MADDNTNRAEHELISTSLDVEQLDVNLFRSKSLWVPVRARGVFGGQVISQAIVSATNSVDPEYRLHVSCKHDRFLLVKVLTMITQVLACELFVQEVVFQAHIA